MNSRLRQLKAKESNGTLTRVERDELDQLLIDQTGFEKLIDSLFPFGIVMAIAGVAVATGVTFSNGKPKVFITDQALTELPPTERNALLIKLDEINAELAAKPQRFLTDPHSIETLVSQKTAALGLAANDNDRYEMDDFLSA